MINLLVEKLDDKVIESQLFYELLDSILLNQNFRGKVPPGSIPKIIKSISSKGIPISAKTIIDENKEKPLVRPDQIKEIIKFNSLLIEKRKQELVDVCSWILPLFRKPVNEPFYINLIIAMDSGQGKTLFANCLEEALKKLAIVHNNNQRKISTLRLNPEMESQGLDLSSFQPGSILILDDMMKTMVANRSENLSLIFIVDKKSISSVSSILKNTIHYTINLEDMNSQDIMEMLTSRYSLSEDKLKMEMLTVVDKLLESKVNPKAILNIVELAAELEKQVQNRNNFIFNKKTIEYLALKAGVKIGYDFNLETLKSQMLSNVFGQNQAINTLTDSIGMAKYGIRNKNRPLLTALFVGPTGVGKTELSITVSDAMFGKDSIIKIDMGEFTEHHSVARLIGAPPGYVGYSSDTAFSAAVRKNPRRVILFDEVEKAAPEVHQLLLNLLDTGKITLSNGEMLDVRDSIIILTSNALVDQIGKVDIGFTEKQKQSRVLNDFRKALEDNKTFPPEFINRIDAIVPFNFLESDNCKRIIGREISKVKESIEYQGYTLKVEEGIEEAILHNTKKPYNGRAIVRSVDTLKRLVVRKIQELKDTNFIDIRISDVKEN